MKQAADLSRFEFCPRLPSLFRILEPERLPIREAVKRYFLRGVRAFYAGDPHPWQESTFDFLKEAAERGYTYPEGEQYVLAQDHASWLDSCLHLLEQIHLEPLPLADVDGEHLEIDGFRRGNEAHLFRVGSQFDAETVKWQEMLLIGQYDAIVVHQFRLPRTSGGRLLSPAVMAYRHPAVDLMRLSRLAEDKRFSGKWKKLARWQLPDVEWPEWAEGIRRDQCLGEIYRTHRIAAEFSQDDLAEIRRDASMMLRYMDRPQPRQRETCGSCMFYGYCHGGEDDRRSYRFAEHPDESMLRVRAGEVDHAVS